MGVNFFPSRWPIMCAAMNQASDLNLAVAVHQAGAMPCLQIKYRDKDFAINYDLINNTLKEFTKQTGSNNLILVVSEEDFLDYNFLKLVKSFYISHVEILSNNLDSHLHCHNPKWLVGAKFLKEHTKIIQRVLDHPLNIDWVDAYGVKGADSAGFTGKLTVAEMFELQKKATPNKAVIPYGGIGTPQQVREYLNKGAAAVAVGTLFAVTHESCLSIETKQAMIHANSSQLTKFNETNQSALILGKVEDTLNDTATWNKESSLHQGIHGNGVQGHVYAGSSIDYVKNIQSVKEVVEYLVSELD